MASFICLFRSECKLILYLANMYVYCVYLVMSKIPKHLPNCLKIVETSIVLNVFKYIAVTITVSFCWNQVPEKLYFGQWPIFFPQNTKLKGTIKFCTNVFSIKEYSLKYLQWLMVAFSTIFPKYCQLKFDSFFVYYLYSLLILWYIIT